MEVITVTMIDLMVVEEDKIREPITSILKLEVWVFLITNQGD